MPSSSKQSFLLLLCPRIDSTLGNLKFTNKGAKDPTFGMAIPNVMLSDEIKASDDYMNYLAKSLGTKPVKSRGEGPLTKKGVEVAAETIRVSKEEATPLIRRRQTGVVISSGVHQETDEEALDHSKQLKGVKIMSETAEYLLKMKQARKSSKQDFILKQCPKGPGEGSGMAPEVHDGLSGSSSSSSSKYKDAIEDISSDDKRSQADDTEKLMKTKLKIKKTGEKNNLWMNKRELINLKRYKLKLVYLSHKLRNLLNNFSVPVRLYLLLNTKLERNVDAMLKIDHIETIDKSVQAHLKNIIPKDVPDFDKIKLEKAAKQQMLKYSTKPFDEASLKEYDLKDKLIKLMIKSKSYNTYPAHELSQTKRRHDDLDPPTDVDKETKKRKRKDSDASSSNKSKDKEESSKDDDTTADDMPHDDATPTQDRSKWFKQDTVVRPETLDPEWHKEPNADNAPE
ncbi:hypothetical protein Tco_0909410 [Tanacetum coccineum]|uniref:Uncharacterized protein n=1 Tax=Tanacetum coccineum TaxID=301880 RepID=A0ABQ5CQ29_9ASTR